MAETPSDEKTPRRFDNRQIATAIAVVLLAWFAISNWQSVRIHFWLTTAKAPLFLVIVLSALLGGIAIKLGESAWLVTQAPLSHRRRHVPARSTRARLATLDVARGR